MNSVLVLPAGSLVDAALSLVRETVDKPIVDHSLRSFFFARLTAQQEGLLTEAAYDEDLLFAATVMHDLGLGTLATGRARFEVEGADLAAGLLAEHGVPDGDIGRVWEAAIVEHARRSPEAAPPFSVAAELLRRAGG